MLRRIDPERYHRCLVHLTVQANLFLARGFCWFLLVGRIIVEQVARIILNNQHVTPFELFFTCEVVVAGFELEIEKVGLGYKPWLGDLGDQ